MPKRMRPVLIACFLLLATLSLYPLWLLEVIREEREEPKTALAATTPNAGKSDLRLDAWVNDSRVVTNKPLGFWIAIQNTSRDEAVHDVRIIAFRRPGFTLPEQQVKAGCWEDGGPSCTNTRVPQTRFKTLTLRARETRTIEGQVVTGSEAGRYSLSAVVEWRDAANVARRKPITVGPIVVENSLKAGALIAAQATQRFLKDLAIPIAMGILAFVLNLIEEKRADAKKTAEEKAAKAQKEAGERAALLQQTWNLMLPKAHANAERHYMPLAANAESVEDSYPKDPELAFFFYLRFFSGMRRLIVKIGGFYLKNRDGEWLLSNVWDSIRKRADEIFTRLNREQAQGKVDPLMTLPEFRRLLSRSAAMAAMKSAFVDPENYRRFDVQVALLRLFKLILEYEMNDVYKPWYGEGEPFPREELKESLASLKWFVKVGQMPGEEFKVFDKRLEKYLESRARARTMHS